ncbi:hypothetical protein Taro_022971 [Colocasia esculenta]|uniref:BHLH domain-containing protein n=1 Tax=Colocasia esculenta TaxID=4460 RepID=A0A843UW01_COLES|nr:hypothetical protein [Colocasia esculenta]
MDPLRGPTDGSGNSREMAEELPFQEIQCLMAENEPTSQNGSSFTALLGLPANQAMELLHEVEAGHSPVISSPAAAEIWRLQDRDQKPLDGFPFGCFPTFPSNPDLVERAARFSVFAAAEDSSPQTTSSGRSNSGVYLAKGVKPEPADSDSNPNSSAGSKPQQQRRQPKRKEPEKSKAKGSTKKTKSSSEGGVPKSAEESNDGEKEKLPYVHVRARRGQATDSHSLAERARREKINARMKLLQELVPGCNKEKNGSGDELARSGTLPNRRWAANLDKSLPNGRWGSSRSFIESMHLTKLLVLRRPNHSRCWTKSSTTYSPYSDKLRLAAVNPRIDFSGIDSFLAAVSTRCLVLRETLLGNLGRSKIVIRGGRMQEANAGGAAGMEQQPPMWPDAHRQQQIWLADLLPPPQSYSSSPPPLWGRDDAEHHGGLLPPGGSLFGYDSVVNPDAYNKPNRNRRHYGNHNDSSAREPIEAGDLRPHSERRPANVESGGRQLPVHNGADDDLTKHLHPASFYQGLRSRNQFLARQVVVLIPVSVPRTGSSQFPFCVPGFLAIQ